MADGDSMQTYSVNYYNEVKGKRETDIVRFKHKEEALALFEREKKALYDRVKDSAVYNFYINKSIDIESITVILEGNRYTVAFTVHNND